MKWQTRSWRAGFLLLTLTTIAGCAHQSIDEPYDPLEPVNRKIFAFNMGLDHYVLEPVSRGYVKITPAPVRRSVTNFFDNIHTPRSMVSNVLQGKPEAGAQDFSRFVLNTTLGVVGIFDVASDMGIPRHGEDFGQTLGVWGLGEGAYLVLPVYGASTVRDGVGFIVDIPLNPVFYLDDGPAFVLTATEIINLRANLDAAMRQLQQAFDPYAFLRASYLQRRQSLVGNGAENGAEDELDDDF